MRAPAESHASTPRLRQRRAYSSVKAGEKSTPYRATATPTTSTRFNFADLRRGGLELSLFAEAPEIRGNDRFGGLRRDLKIAESARAIRDHRIALQQPDLIQRQQRLRQHPKKRRLDSG